MTDDLRSRLVADLVRDEGERLRPYRCTAGALTIGVGRNLDAKGISQRISRVMLDEDIDDVLRELDGVLPWWRNLSEARQAGLANMAFNLGLSGLLGFRQMLSALKAGDYERAAREALASRWASQVGARANHIADAIRAG